MAKALWRRAFDAAESAAGPRVEQLVRNTTFSTTVVVLQRTRSWVGRATERRTRRVWHLVNLPAGSDVQRLRRQVGDLDREVRLLREVLEAERADDRPAAQTDEARGLPRGGRSGAASTRRGAGTGATGRGAQRAASP